MFFYPKILRRYAGVRACVCARVCVCGESQTSVCLGKSYPKGADFFKMMF